MQQKEEKKSRVVTEDKITLQEFEIIDKELEQFRVDGKLTTDGEWKWLAMRGAVVLQEHFGPAVRYENGKPLLPGLERKLNQYKWLKNLQKNNEFHKYEVDKKQEDLPEINPEDIPF